MCKSTPRLWYFGGIRRGLGGFFAVGIGEGEERSGQHRRFEVGFEQSAVDAEQHDAGRFFGVVEGRAGGFQVFLFVAAPAEGVLQFQEPGVAFGAGRIAERGLVFLEAIDVNRGFGEQFAVVGLVEAGVAFRQNLDALPHRGKRKLGEHGGGIRQPHPAVERADRLA